MIIQMLFKKLLSQLAFIVCLFLLRGNVKAGM